MRFEEKQAGNNHENGMQQQAENNHEKRVQRSTKEKKEKIFIISTIASTSLGHRIVQSSFIERNENNRKKAVVSISFPSYFCQLILV